MTGDRDLPGHAPQALPVTEADRRRSALVGRLVSRGTVRNPAVRRALRTVPRHSFLPGVDLRIAYADEAVALKWADGRALSSVSQPTMVASMLEMLDVQLGAHILEIGTGSGYNAALLSELAGEGGLVVSVEIDSELARDRGVAARLGRIRGRRGSRGRRSRGMAGFRSLRQDHRNSGGFAARAELGPPAVRRWPDGRAARRRARSRDLRQGGRPSRASRILPRPVHTHALRASGSGRRTALVCGRLPRKSGVRAFASEPRLETALRAEKYRSAEAVGSDLDSELGDERDPAHWIRDMAVGRHTETEAHDVHRVPDVVVSLEQDHATRGDPATHRNGVLGRPLEQLESGGNDGGGLDARSTPDA